MTSQPTLSSLYPRARKLQFELKMQMSYLDASYNGTKLMHQDLQQEARENLNSLQQLVWQLESILSIDMKDTSIEKENWNKKIAQLRIETTALGESLEQHIFYMQRKAVQKHERENLFNRRNGMTFDTSNSTYDATQEGESLQRSTQMVSDLIQTSSSILGDLGDQRTRMKGVRTKVLDIANRLGLSSSLLRVIERRETVDFYIVLGGMLLTLGFFYACYSYVHSSSTDVEMP